MIELPQSIQAWLLRSSGLYMHAVVGLPCMVCKLKSGVGKTTRPDAEGHAVNA